MKNIVTADWLMDNMGRDNVVILDCRFSLNDPDYGERAYKQAHIKNAVYIDLERDLSGVKKEHGGRHPLPEIEGFVKKMEEVGIRNDSTVVIYDDGDMPGASRLWWMLKYIGKENVYVLDGGINQWRLKEGEITTEIPDNTPVKGKLSVDIKSDMLCDIEYVKDNIENEHAVIVDSRANERYKGIVEPMENRAGHIPGAVNYFWQEIIDNNRIKNIEDIKDRFKDLKKYDKLIVHCGSGITACPNIIAMQETGLKPILYLGGFSDWVSYNKNEVVRE